MYYIKSVFSLYFLVLCYKLSNAASLQKSIDNKLEGDISLKIFSNNFVRRLRRNTVHSIKKRSTCLSTLASYTKHNCQDIISDDAQNLAIKHWPQAQTTGVKCKGEGGYSIPANIPKAAATVVRVWNKELKIWQKIKVTVGHVCARSFSNS